MSTRFTAEAAAIYRKEITQSGGVEVFAIGDLNKQGMVYKLTVHCRGNQYSVPALLSRPLPGQVVIHNHPSGILQASPADMHLANLYGEDGIGVVIVNNDVTEGFWVVEPHVSKLELIDEAEIEDFFLEKLPLIMPDFEPREGQLQMALEITQAMNNGEMAILEAGTGTGKSLAYLVPSVMWAVKNKTRVVVATYTITLQGQLINLDLPILKAAGLDFEHALVKGRRNYICKRKLEEEVNFTKKRLQHLQKNNSSEDSHAEIPNLGFSATPTSQNNKNNKTKQEYVQDARSYLDLLQTIEDYTKTYSSTQATNSGIAQNHTQMLNSDESSIGSRSDISFPIADEVWEDIASDHEQTLRSRCPHYNSCFYYTARRKAAKAHILIANHHMLMIDMRFRAENNGEGLLPSYNRVIIDEGHHLEDAATSMFQQQVSTRVIRRSLTPIRNRKEKPSALERMKGHITSGLALFENPHKTAMQLVEELEILVPQVWDLSDSWMQQIANDFLDPDTPHLRLRKNVEQDPRWKEGLEPMLQRAEIKIGAIADKLAKLEDIISSIDEQTQIRDPQPFLDIQRTKRKMQDIARFFHLFRVASEEQTVSIDTIVQDPSTTNTTTTTITETEETVRWIEKISGKNRVPTSALTMAPVEVGPVLREQLFLKLKSVVSCSATLTVDNKFEHYQNRIGLQNIPEGVHIRNAILPSPFDYQKQALLVIPKNMPDPQSKHYFPTAVKFIVRAIQASNGGCFILCTNYSLLRKLHAEVSKELKDQYRFFRQGEMGRTQLLDAFIQSQNGVLFGADSYWEGVSVKGERLRQVIITKLPFRVPTEPVQQARHEKLEVQGLNPFVHYSLPQAALRLRQGFGRLIRTQNDRGSVVILDSRVHKKWYGKIFLNSLPKMEICRDNCKESLQRMEQFFAPTSREHPKNSKISTNPKNTQEVLQATTPAPTANTEESQL